MIVFTNNRLSQDFPKTSQCSRLSVCCNGGSIVWPKYIAISRFDPIKVNILTLCRNSCHHQNCFRPHFWVSGRCPNILMTIYWGNLLQTSFFCPGILFSVSTVCPVSQNWAGVSAFATLYRNMEWRKCWWWKTLLPAWLQVSASQSPVYCVSGLDIIQSNYSDDGRNPISQRKIFYTFEYYTKYQNWDFIIHFQSCHFRAKSLVSVEQQAFLKNGITIWILFPQCITSKWDLKVSLDHNSVVWEGKKLVMSPSICPENVSGLTPSGQTKTNGGSDLMLTKNLNLWFSFLGYLNTIKHGLFAHVHYINIKCILLRNLLTQFLIGYWYCITVVTDTE